MESEPKKKRFLDKFLLPGKVALVTGGSRGIGKAIALALAEAGADIILASRKLPDLEATSEEISRMGRKVLPVQANVRNLSEINDLVKKSVDEFGHIDILVNNAGSSPVFGSVSKMDERVWDTVLDLNLKGYFFLSQAVSETMRNHGGGTIINTSSIGGFIPGLGLGIYSISKAGVNMLTKVLAQEWGQYNIRVNAIAPGLTKTRFTEVQWKDPVRVKDYENNVALGRLAEPEEMANAALFLASEASSYMTGSIIILDGGSYASVGTLVKNLD